MVTAPVSAGSVRTRIALIIALMSSGRERLAEADDTTMAEDAENRPDDAGAGLAHRALAALED